MGVSRNYEILRSSYERWPIMKELPNRLDAIDIIA